MSKPAVFGIVENETQAQAAVVALESVGFASPDISVLGGSADASGVVVPAGVEYADVDPTVDINGKTREVGHTNTTKAPEGTTVGVTTGGVLGGVAGWLVGIGALAIPGVGPFVAAGPILAALSGAAIGAAAGGVAGALVGYGIPEYEANLYAGKLKEGHILIGVHAVNSDEAAAAKKALESVKAQDIKVTSEVFAK